MTRVSVMHGYFILETHHVSSYSMPFPLVAENDRRNRYTVTVEGLDEEGRLAAPLGSDVTLNVKITGKWDQAC